MLRRFNVTRQIAAAARPPRPAECITFCVSAHNGADASRVADLCKFAVEQLRKIHPSGANPAILEQVREYA